MTSKRTKIIVGTIIAVFFAFIIYREICAIFIVYFESQAEELMDEGEYEKALDKLFLSRKFLIKDEIVEINSAYFGECYFHLGMYEEALKHFQDALVDCDSENESIYYSSIGFTYEKLGKYDKAMENYLYALDAGYDAPDLILERIDALESSYE